MIFPPGLVVIGEDVMQELGPGIVATCLRRHFAREHGEVDEDTLKTNAEAVATGRGVVRSTFEIRGDRLAILTDEDGTFVFSPLSTPS